MEYGVIIKELPIMQAKHQSGDITNKQYEDYLIKIIDYCGEIDDIRGYSKELNEIKDLVFTHIDFLT